MSSDSWILEDVSWLIREDPNLFVHIATHWDRESVLGLHANSGSSVDDWAGVDLDAHCCDQVSLVVVRVYEESHGLHGHSFSAATCNLEVVLILDHRGFAVGVGEICCQHRVVNHDEGWQVDHIVTLFGLVEAESVIDWCHGGYNLEISIKQRLLVELNAN